LQQYDLVITGGRVIDAETNFDGFADVAVRNGIVKAIEPEIDQSNADDVLDVSGNWVIPGMIDTHVHVANASDLGRIRGMGLQMVAAAGATTVIDLGGSMDALIEGIKVRGSGVNVASLGYLKPGETVPNSSLSQTTIRGIVETALDAGSIGIKLWAATTHSRRMKQVISLVKLTTLALMSPTTLVPLSPGPVSME